MSENSNGVTVTLKGGQGFEAPWIVIHATDATDALNQINDPKFADLTDRTVAAATFFRGQAAVKGSFPGASTVNEQGRSWSQQGSQQAPPQFAQRQAAPAAPAGEGKSCIHGPMVYREAKPGSGKNWRAYFCPTPQGTPGQCKAEFLR